MLHDTVNDMPAPEQYWCFAEEVAAGCLDCLIACSGALLARDRRCHTVHLKVPVL